MSNNSKGALIIFLLLFAAMAVLPPAIFGRQATPSNYEDLKDGWLTFIYNYQTLITGVFAVGAAYVTVRQMQESDRQQELRHRRQIYLDRRREILGARRFLTRIASSLDFLDECGRRFRSHMAEVADPGMFDATHVMENWTWQAKVDYFFALNLIRGLNEKLNSTPSSAPTYELELLTPDADVALDRFKFLLQDAAKIVDDPSSYTDMHVNDGRPPMNYSYEVEGIILGLADAAKYLRGELDTWLQQLSNDLNWINH